MLLRRFAVLAMAGGFWTAVSGAWAQAGAGAAEPAASAREVRAWLMRIHDAAGHRNFQGTFVVSGGGAVSSARIAHFCEGPNQYERSESLDGQARFVFRHNNLVHTVWPGTRVALVEQRTLLASFPALLQAGDDRIADFYDVRPDGVERVAGHEANVLLVRSKDLFRYGYRLWADQASGLLLRADVIGERNEVLETSAFSEVTIGVKPQPESVLLPMKRLDGYRVLRPVLTPTPLEAEGWALKLESVSARAPASARRILGCAFAAVRRRWVISHVSSAAGASRSQRRNGQAKVMVKKSKRQNPNAKKYSTDGKIQNGRRAAGLRFGLWKFLGV